VLPNAANRTIIRTGGTTVDWLRTLPAYGINFVGNYRHYSQNEVSVKRFARDPAKISAAAKVPHVGVSPKSVHGNSRLK
jgi:hypothetical protein